MPCASNATQVVELVRRLPSVIFFSFTPKYEATQRLCSTCLLVTTSGVVPWASGSFFFCFLPTFKQSGHHTVSIEPHGRILAALASASLIREACDVTWPGDQVTFRWSIVRVVCSICLKRAWVLVSSMKFRGRIVDIVCIQQFSKIVHTVSKLAKDVTMRITADYIFFILNEDAVNGGGWLWADIPQESLFQEYNMQGVSEEFNEIYLDVVADHIVKALKSAVAAKSLKVKLTKKQTPCLSFEIELPSLVPTSRTVVHDVPVSVIPRRLWNNFAQPEVEQGDVSTAAETNNNFTNKLTDGRVRLNPLNRAVAHAT